MRKIHLLRFSSTEQIANPNFYDRGADLSTRTLLRVTDGILARVEALSRRLPIVGLSGEDRRRIGGSRLPGYDGEIVERVADALRKEPQLFRDIVEDGDELRQRQRLAERLELLRCFLRILLDACDDLYLVIQGDTMRRAVAVLDRVRDSAAVATAADHQHHYDRLSALSPALSLLAEVRGGIHARRGAHKEDKPAASEAKKRGRAVTRRKLSDLFFKAR